MSEGKFYKLSRSQTVRVHLNEALESFPAPKERLRGIHWHYDYDEVMQWLKEWFGIEIEP